TCRRSRDGAPEEDRPVCPVRDDCAYPRAINDYIRGANKKPGQHLFGGRRGCDRAITTRQYAPLVVKWISSIGLDSSLFGTHSLRRTKATHLPSHRQLARSVTPSRNKKIESTVRYQSSHALPFAC